MFQHASSALPTDAAAVVIDVANRAPEDNSYGTLKRAVISRLSESQEKRVHQLLLQVELGDRTPSQLLRHMRSLLGETGAVVTPTPDRVTTQQSDVLTKLVENWNCLCQTSPHNLVTSNVPISRNNQIVLLNIEIKSATIIGYLEMTERNVSQAANTPRLTQLSLRETWSVLTSALSLVLQKSAFLNPPAGPCKRQTITFQSSYISLCYLDSHKPRLEHGRIS
ncbi:unnamed protein product [Hymenolepis diminuta]|uniref:DUF7041 domain-containing protein n=1 Tax=Hymenolepis diminuta TaxID=6216 RepID=A0A564Z1T5_HYMDI|nr:unnamed protein product [Hymenolepis diminuta]